MSFEVWFINTPTQTRRLFFGRALIIFFTSEALTSLFELGTKLNPKKSAPYFMAAFAAPAVLIPQIFTSIEFYYSSLNSQVCENNLINFFNVGSKFFLSRFF